MKRMIILFLTLVVCITVAAPVLAADVQPSVDTYGIEEIQPRIEETRWYFRTVDGVKQMRLWSITYGKWLTDWITVE